MKKLFNIVLLSIGFQLVLVSCKRNELDPAYKAKSQVIITGDRTQGAIADSVDYTFAIQPDGTEVAEIKMYALALGNLSDAPRTIRLQADPAITTALPGEYEIPAELTVGANQFRVSFTVKLKRTDRLKTNKAKLVVQVVENADFNPGPRTPGTPEQIGNMQYINPNLGPSFNLIFSDMLVQPSTWSTSLVYYVGKWSKTKHQLMIDAVGGTIRNFDNLTTSQNYYLQASATRALAEYNANHPNDPMRNEFNEILGICASCN